MSKLSLKDPKSGNVVNTIAIDFNQNSKFFKNFTPVVRFNISMPDFSESSFSGGVNYVIISDGGVFGITLYKVDAVARTSYRASRGLQLLSLAINATLYHIGKIVIPVYPLGDGGDGQ